MPSPKKALFRSAQGRSQFGASLFCLGVSLGVSLAEARTGAV